MSADRAGAGPTVGIYNQYWTTGGGAETYGGAMAQVLARSRPVELLGPEPVVPAELADRLRLDLAGVTFRTVDPAARAVEAASADYDLFVNVSHMSDAPSRADRSLFVVHFPTEVDADLGPAQRAAIRLLGPLVRSQSVETRWGKGFYPREGPRPRCFWTDGAARFTVQADPERPTPVRLVFVPRRPVALGPVEVRVEVAGAEAARLTLEPGGRADRLRGESVVVTVPADPRAAEVDVAVLSDTFVPVDHGLGDDDRRLGVALRSIHTGAGARDRIGAALGAWFPLLYRLPASREFLDSYDHLVANSEFTSTWVRRWWDRDAAVLYPPVRMHEAGDKDQVILAVGRFFAARSGHSKKQLELVEAFRRLLDQGVEGWTLALVGGCSADDRPYLEAVQAAAEGLPVELHVDAPGGELEALYARASLFWHATGLGEDPDADPERLEHFGIATVEAMSAGAVPVVYGAAGQLEVVTDGVDGCHFTDLDGLVAATRALIDDPDRRARLAEAAAVRAQDFSLDRFAERLEGLLAG